MKKTINFNDFIDEFIACNKGNQFSYNGLKALYDWIEEELPDFELDVIGLCSEFTEYNNIEEIKRDYNNKDYDGIDYIDYINNIDDLYNYTYVIEFNGGIIIRNF